MVRAGAVSALQNTRALIFENEPVIKGVHTPSRNGEFITGNNGHTTESTHIIQDADNLPPKVRFGPTFFGRLEEFAGNVRCLCCLKLDSDTVGDFPQVGIKFRGQTEVQIQALENEFHETPWISFQCMLGFVFAVCTGFFEISVQLPETPPRAFLDTRSLLDDGTFRVAFELGAATKLGKRIAAADEFPDLVRRYLSGMGFLQPAEPQTRRGIRLAWMRRAHEQGWGWKEFRRFYLYKFLSEEQRAALDEDIRRVCYK